MNDKIQGLLRRVWRFKLDTSTPSVQADVESLADEPHRGLEVLETYGTTAAPPDDVLEGVGLFFNGESDHGVIVGWMDKKHRPRGLEAGERVTYSVFGQSVKYDKQGRIILTDKAGSTITMDGAGGIDIRSQTLTHNGINIGSTHIHPQNSGNHFGGGTNTNPPQ